jgi:hypothetical protein
VSELRSNERASHETSGLNPLQPQVPQPTSMDRNVFFCIPARQRELVEMGPTTCHTFENILVVKSPNTCIIHFKNIRVVMGPHTSVINLKNMFVEMGRTMCHTFVKCSCV